MQTCFACEKEPGHCFQRPSCCQDGVVPEGLGPDTGRCSRRRTCVKIGAMFNWGMLAKKHRQLMGPRFNLNTVFCFFATILLMAQPANAWEWPRQPCNRLKSVSAAWAEHWRRGNLQVVSRNLRAVGQWLRQSSAGREALGWSRADRQSPRVHLPIGLLHFQGQPASTASWWLSSRERAPH